MRDDVIALLRCPLDAGALRGVDGALGCAGGHRFDVARQGYVNLLPGGGGAGTADTAGMVQARVDVLGAGTYDPLDRALTAEAVHRAAVSGAVVDLGAGTAHHLARVLDRLEGHVGLALDISKHAARRAARAHPRAGAAVADVWQPLPVADDVADLVLNVFAPRNGPEVARILRPGGTLLVVTPTSRHLAEIVGPLGMLTVGEDKDARLEASLAPDLALVDARTVTSIVSMDHGMIEQVVAMGPSAWHMDPGALRAGIAALPHPLPVTTSFTISTFRHR